eukprot:CAMPEP_0172750552 /NCGR_PEP_ID=MMETSP1074-20121228/149846_1 /TAXON_ID=2916 /ORGANISM="Ceratium fusus, Strain PA161109" /LENGTH=56 /DNA_ID=CAMNT_0013582713 /DNA_START=180 /DNA_END=350 /DNA_ORIENTATION=-
MTKWLDQLQNQAIASLLTAPRIDEAYISRDVLMGADMPKNVILMPEGVLIIGVREA